MQSRLHTETCLPSDRGARRLWIPGTHACQPQTQVPTVVKSRRRWLPSLRDAAISTRPLGLNRVNVVAFVAIVADGGIRVQARRLQVRRRAKVGRGGASIAR